MFKITISAALVIAYFACWLLLSGIMHGKPVKVSLPATAGSIAILGALLYCGGFFS